VGTTEDSIQLLVICCFQIQVEQHLLHQIKVFARLFKKDLIELGQVN
jgi:hypothetical protein